MRICNYGTFVRLTALVVLLAVCLMGCGESSTEPAQTIAPTRVPIVLEPAAEATVPEEAPVRTENSLEQVIYQEAMDHLAEGDEMMAAGRLMLIPDYADAAQILHEIVNRQARSRAQTFGYNYGIKNDGSVVLRELTQRNEAGEYVPVESPDWEDVVTILTATNAGVVGLLGDGTVVATNPNTPEAQIMSQWMDVIEIHDYFGGVIGLRADGTVVTTMEESVLNEWEDVVQIAMAFFGAYGLKADGTVVAEFADMADVSGWTDVVKLEVGMNCVVGLRADGTVLAVDGYSDLQPHVADWTDIVDIDVYDEIMGLRSDGTVVVTSCSGGQYVEESGGSMDFSGWTDIVAIDTWGLTFLGLKADGTMVAEGLDEGGQLNVGHWQNIKAMLVDSYSTFGLCEDGTLLVTGYGDEVLWTDIRCPGE